MMDKFAYRTLLIVLFVTGKALSIDGDNSPPILSVTNRELELEESMANNSFVLKAYASDNENDTLVFGLEAEDPRKPIPFRIDQESGAVYLAENLTGRAGETISFYVTVFDGGIPSKLEIIVNIVEKLSNKRPPLFSPSLNPFLHLPASRTNMYKSNQEYSVKETTSRRTVTNLTPYRPHFVEKEKILEDVVKNTSRDVEVTTKRAPLDRPVKAPPEITATLVPVLSVCGIFAVVGVLGFMFRKKIYLGKPKDSKEDMRKESSSPAVIVEPDLALQHWNGPRAFSNRYEPHQFNYQQHPVENQLSAPVKKSDKWEFPRHRLKFFNILGEGAFGQVWKCEAIDIDGQSGGHVVAVKTLKENATDKERSDLISELQVMKMLDPHPNVVRLLGCCTDKDPIFVIMQYVSRGKMQSYLRNSRAERFYNNMHGPSKTLTSRDLTSFLYQVAKGMEFLSANGIIHRDLAARNVLITEEHTCKVADFGFARDIISSYVYERKSEGRLPIRWMAPESLYDNIFSSKSDVWSFGIFMWEVVTLGSTPYPGMSAAEVMKKVRDGYRLDKPEHCRRELYNIMYYCWDKDPKERPSFSECVQLLEKLLTTETDYIELERFPDHSYYNMLSISGEKL